MDRKITIAAVILVLGAVFAFWRLPAKNTGAPKKEIILGVDFSDTFSSPVLVAEDQGYFRDAGLAVKIIEYPSGRTAISDMVEKKNLDVVTVAQTPVMYNSFFHDNYAVIAGMSSSYDAGGLLLARKAKGISAVSNLKGRKIGTPVGSTGHFFLNLFLIHNRLKIQDVQIIDIDAPSLPGALADGRIDAISIWQPQIYKAQKMLGGNTIILPGKNIYRVDFYLAADKNFIKQNKEALKGLLKAVDRAEDFILKNKEKSIDIVSSRMKMDRNIVAAIWDQYQFKLFLDQAILTDLEAEARWAIANKYTPAAKAPDYRKFIHTDILESIKPEAVNLIH